MGKKFVFEENNASFKEIEEKKMFYFIFERDNNSDVEEKRKMIEKLCENKI